MTLPPPSFDHVDVLIIGAGISGIGVACHLSMSQPGRTFAVVESRHDIGGTWDLFRYPGIRSDADLLTFGFTFKPWDRENSIADADEILDYLNETVEEYGLRPHLHLGHKVRRAVFDTAEARWTITLERVVDGSEFVVTAAFLFAGTGYYDYAAGYTPEFDGIEDFGGEVIHPQHWPEDLDVAGRRVVVIGSGATAVTLLPSLAALGAHATMLQRSPGYVVSMPRRDPFVNGLRRILPPTLAYRISRRRNLLRQQLLYSASRRYPALMRRVIRHLNARALPEGFDVDVHFNPVYDPWDERMCLVPDNDLFEAIRDGKATVVTDHIQRFTAEGLELKSGDTLEADIIVTATGLNLQAFGGIDIVVDGMPVVPGERVVYKSAMLDGVPNFVFALGYSNASWTLKVDLLGEYLCRLVGYMDRHAYDVATPVLDDPAMPTDVYYDLPSGYMQRGVHRLPRRGVRGPWTVEQSYTFDRERLCRSRIDDSALHFTRSSANDQKSAARTGGVA
ncbi:NAD(P)/FAD-dependent oxidoreductase [Pseudonocardia kujensis]|uniref:flavin-containing monooxygenase n=1 Tax=Pseudonocardia kujensis TaxID=1128675 RepID=UPI001E440111|nr:NAD(P)/FAD-dependent oxidoreductase [Pseudonocardia kujensis]MCE0768659.1 NAD(P)/FAD-dependent oxidoreductase [Pseudonocardia kujensis]